MSSHSGCFNISTYRMFAANKENNPSCLRVRIKRFAEKNKFASSSESSVEEKSDVPAKRILGVLSNKSCKINKNNINGKSLRNEKLIKFTDSFESSSDESFTELHTMISRRTRSQFNLKHNTGSQKCLSQTCNSRISTKSFESPLNIRKTKSPLLESSSDDDITILKIMSPSNKSARKQKKKKIKSIKRRKTSSKKSTFSKFSGPLPCRDKEFYSILNFITGHLTKKTGGCMYIAGVPGTGKTATVHAVVDNLTQNNVLSKHNCQFVEINGMQLTSPVQAYVQMYLAITDKPRLSPDASLDQLEKIFSPNRGDKHPVLLLVDELDLLVTQRQEVLYNILDWPARRNSRLIALTISNTLDLPERALKGRVASRLGATRLPFLPYTYKELIDILNFRVSGHFHCDAIELIARRVASLSGDARRAMDIAQRAKEISDKDEVNIRAVSKAFEEMMFSSALAPIRNVSFIQRLILKAFLSICSRTGKEETIADDLYNECSTICLLEGRPLFSWSIFMRSIDILTQIRIIYAEPSKNGLWQKIFLNVCFDNMRCAIKSLDER